jgi:cobalt/nickel transport system permease protein
LAAGFFSMKKRLQENRRTMIILAMSGAFIFVISSLKIPSVTGSCSHMTGTGMGALLFGPSAVSVLGIIVLIFQAILLAHGGLTSLGANTFSMAIAGPFVSYAIYQICKKLKVNKSVSIFLAAAVGDLFTYCVTSVQLALAYPSANGGVAASAVKFLGVFAPTQLPLAIVEGILTVVVINGLEKYADSELMDIGFIAQDEVVRTFNWKQVAASIIAVVLIAAVPFFALKGAEFGGSDDAGSEMVAEIRGEEYEPWFEPVLETAIGGELPGEIESLLFCVQTGIGVGILAFGYGRLTERKKLQTEQSA